MSTTMLSVGSTESMSEDIVVASGESTVVGLTGVVDGMAQVSILLYDGAAYNVVGEIRSHCQVAHIRSPGTYRLLRIAGGVCGAYASVVVDGAPDGTAGQPTGLLLILTKAA